MATSKLRLWRRFGRISSAVILVCFFLPFFGVSCGGMDMITASGADMVGGCRPGGMLMEAADQQKQRHHASMDGDDGAAAAGNMDMDLKIDKVDREPLAIVAMALCIALLAVSLLRTRGAMIGAMILSIAALATLGGLYGKVKSKINDDIAEMDKKDPGAQDPESKAFKRKLDKDMEIDAGGRYGLWIVMLGLIGTAAVIGMALKEKDEGQGLV
jgi:hypothetical protein